MTRQFIAPIDDTHREALAARERIRLEVRTLRDRAAAWSPRPCPKVQR